ncbi:MAG: Hsp20/alpha crystallin family protein [Candidatus Bathyarchaeia archaeon]
MIQKKEASALGEKESVPIIPKQRPPSMVEPYKFSELWIEFDRAFDRVRREFEALFGPLGRIWEREISMMQEFETRLPALDLEDRGDKYVLTADVPGFKSDEIEINVWDNSVELSGCREMKQSEELTGYVRKERSLETFYRKITLPEEVKVDDATATLQNGILEVTLPKKIPKEKKKIQIK